MDTKETTLQAVVLTAGRSVSIDAWNKALKGSVIGMKLGPLTPQLMGGLEKSIHEEAGKALDMSVLDYLMAGWSQVDQVLAAIDSSKKKPKDPVELALDKHTVKADQPIPVEIFLDEKSLGTLELSIATEFVVEALQLHLLNGKIREVRTGTCQGSVSLKYKDFALHTWPTDKIPLPGAVKLKDKQNAKDAEAEKGDLAKTGPHPKVVPAARE